MLAGKLDHTAITGFGGYSDDQLAGVMLAAARQQSRAVAQLLAAVSELAARRAADPDPRVAGATGTELAVLTPGVFAWRLPNGRSYTINPGIYPT